MLRLTFGSQNSVFLEWKTDDLHDRGSAESSELPLPYGLQNRW